VDVSGTRSGRKQWINTFPGVSAIIFCVAISEYNQNLYEDETKNRLVESLTLFNEILQSHWFIYTPIFLFLNKTDVFAQKIKSSDLSEVFPDYKGGFNYGNGIKFIFNKFLELNKDSKERPIFPYFTCATDTESIDQAFKYVKEQLLELNLMSVFV